MFEVYRKKDRKLLTVYGVRKSGPADEQTKFLVYDGRWRWVWAGDVAPAGGRTERIARPAGSAALLRPQRASDALRRGSARLKAPGSQRNVRPTGRLRAPRRPATVEAGPSWWQRRGQRT
ncbi:MAG: hypothetical protein D6731_07405 [Planctomycetota bacterium]|nr:MAG: hypothetical protein D6731_07405 [Planctomycetota bacterium]